MAINPKFIDVDFRKDPRYVFGNNAGRIYGAKRATYEESVGVVPQSEWGDRVKEIDESNAGIDRLITRIMDQGQEGSCVSFACSQAFQIVMAVRAGTDRVVQLSPMSLYKRIGSSPSSGAMVEDGLDELVSRGILPLDTPENRAKFTHVFPERGFYTPYPNGWETTAAQFKVIESFVLESVTGVISALLRGHPVVVGRQGHSICYCRPMFRDNRYGQINSLVAKYANSWGDWGDNGFGYDSYGTIQQASYWAFAIRDVTAPI